MFLYHGMWRVWEKMEYLPTSQAFVATSALSQEGVDKLAPSMPSDSETCVTYHQQCNSKVLLWPVVGVTCPHLGP
jgi:hypothetical protein